MTQKGLGNSSKPTRRCTRHYKVLKKIINKQLSEIEELKDPSKKPA